MGPIRVIVLGACNLSGRSQMSTIDRTARSRKAQFSAQIIVPDGQKVELLRHAKSTAPSCCPTELPQQALDLPHGSGRAPKDSSRFNSWFGSLGHRDIVARWH